MCRLCGTRPFSEHCRTERRALHWIRLMASPFFGELCTRCVIDSRDSMITPTRISRRRALCNFQSAYNGSLSKIRERNPLRNVSSTKRTGEFRVSTNCCTSWLPVLLAGSSAAFINRPVKTRVAEILVGGRRSPAPSASFDSIEILSQLFSSVKSLHSRSGAINNVETSEETRLASETPST